MRSAYQPLSAVEETTDAFSKLPQEVTALILYKLGCTERGRFANTSSENDTIVKKMQVNGPLTHGELCETYISVQKEKQFSVDVAEAKCAAMKSLYDFSQDLVYTAAGFNSPQNLVKKHSGKLVLLSVGTLLASIVALPAVMVVPVVIQPKNLLLAHSTLGGMHYRAGSKVHELSAEAETLRSTLRISCLR